VTPAVIHISTEAARAQALHREFLSHIETLTLNGIKTRIDNLMDHVQYILNTKKTDFGAKENISLDRPSVACQAICNLIAIESDIVFQCLDGKNKTICCDVIGGKCFILLKH
jgi:hypothetical protein